MNTDFLTITTKETSATVEGKFSFLRSNFNVTAMKTAKGVASMMFSSVFALDTCVQLQESTPCKVLQVNEDWFCFLLNFKNGVADSFVVTKMTDGTRTKFYL